VSNREGDKLEATLGALDQAQGTSDFKKQRAKVQEQIRLSKELINNAFEEQYGDIKAETSQKPSDSNAYNEYLNAYKQATTNAGREAINARARANGVIK
jgi:hypothetical protein